MTNDGPEPALSTDQREYADEVRRALARTFGIPSDEVRLVVEETAGGARRVVAIDASPNGQYAGTFDAIAQRRRSDPTFFTVAVRGEIIDVLSASTEAAYRAMSADVRRSGFTAPDSLALSQENHELWTATMLVGEPLTADGLIQIASVSGGVVNKVGFRTDRGGRSIRVRPAVLIAELHAAT